jgi:hypothetical protein
MTGLAFRARLDCGHLLHISSSCSLQFAARSGGCLVLIGGLLRLEYIFSSKDQSNLVCCTRIPIIVLKSIQSESVR